jgi:hypothetical protein
MRRASAVLGATMLALFASAASAQKPDFSGTWTLDAEKTQAANPAQQGGGGGGGGGGRMGGGMGGGPLTIKVDATSFTTERQGQNGAVTATYKLDGTPTQTAQGQMQVTGKAAWQGTTIVVESTRQIQGNNITSKETYAIEGEYLVITREQPGRDGGAPTTRKSYYKKG